MLLAALAFISFGFTSCNGNDDKNENSADMTELNTLITSCESLLSSATTTDYPQSAITTFSTTLSAVKAAVAKGGLSQSTVNNLVTQLTAAKDTFEAAAYGAIPASALTFGLSFDEGTGTSLKTTGSNTWTATLQKGPSDIFGTDTGIPTFVTGKVGKALHFDKGAHLEIADYASGKLLGNALSIAVWVKPDELYANNYIISYNYWNTWKFQVQDGGKPFFTGKTDNDACVDFDNETDNSVPANAWTQLVVSVDLKAKTVSFYVNGSLTKLWDSSTKAGSFSNTFASYGTTLPICIGACTTIDEAKTWSWFSTEVGQWGYFKGTLDELKVYNIALTDGQVSKLYNDEK